MRAAPSRQTVDASKHETGGCEIPTTRQLAVTALNVSDTRCIAGQLAAWPPASMPGRQVAATRSAAA